MIIGKFHYLSKLNFSEKLQLIEELWDEISREDSHIPVSERHQEELDERQRQYDSNPEHLLALNQLQERLGHKK